jgi:hypothetical protein
MLTPIRGAPSIPSVTFPANVLLSIGAFANIEVTVKRKRMNVYIVLIIIYEWELFI